MVDFSDIEYDEYLNRTISMLHRHEHMLSGQRGEIKGVSHCIELNPGTLPIRQQPCRAGIQRMELIEEHVTKMLEAEVVEPL